MGFRISGFRFSAPPPRGGEPCTGDEVGDACDVPEHKRPLHGENHDRFEPEGACAKPGAHEEGACAQAFYAWALGFKL